jgi:ankyrin repeat protein
VQYLVKVLGTDVNQANNAGVTPLMAAARTNNQPIIKQLCSKVCKTV